MSFSCSFLFLIVYFFKSYEYIFISLEVACMLMIFVLFFFLFVPVQIWCIRDVSMSLFVPQVYSCEETVIGRKGEGRSFHYNTWHCVEWSLFSRRRTQKHPNWFVIFFQSLISIHFFNFSFLCLNVCFFFFQYLMS